MSRVLTVAWEDENIFCQFEDNEGFRFLHVEVNNFSKSLIREWRDTALEVKQKCIDDGYSSLYTYTQNKKFVKILSKEFKEIGIFLLDDEIYEVMKWEF